MTAEIHHLSAAERLVAHRGWARRYPENTLSSVRGALEAGARAVEIDVQLTRDLVPFLFHDRTLARLCGVPGSMAERTSAEIARLFASETARLGPRFAAEPLASLDSFVELLGDWPGVLAFVELKRVSLEAFGRERVLEAVLPRLAPLTGRAALISFDLEVLQLARSRSLWPLGPVFDAWGLAERAAASELGSEFVFCDLDGLGAARTIDLPGSEVIVYEVAEAEMARQLFARGASRVETFDIGPMLAQLAAEERPKGA